MKPIDIIIINTLIAILFFVVGIFVGDKMEEETIKDNLVKSGHAEYYLDKKNNRQWRMKSCPKRK